MIARRQAPPYAILAAISLFYVVLLLIYTHGALLFGSDNVGVYSVSQLTQDQSPNTLMFVTGIALAFGNFYVGFYVALFLSSLLVIVGVYKLTDELFRGRLGDHSITAAGLVGALLYLFNPTALTVDFESFTTNVYVSQAAFLLFLIELVRYWRASRRGLPFRLRDGLMMGVGLGLSVELFPNNIRILTVGMLLFGYFTVLSIIPSHRSMKIPFNVSSRLRTLITCLGGAFLAGSYSFLPVLMNVGLYVQIAAEGAAREGGIQLFQGSFNALPQVIRLLGVWAFPTNYAPYHTLYFDNSIVTVSSYFWPVLAIGLPLILARRTSRGVILPVVALMIGMVFWEKAGNPPLGEIYTFLVAHLPLGDQLIPTFLLSTLVLSKLYAVMAGYSIVSLSLVLRTRLGRIRMPRLVKAWVPIATGSLLVAILLIAAWPAFNGQVEGQYFDENVKGFWVPSEYQTVRAYLESQTGNALLLPATGVYVQTNWGYQGAIRFYDAYFAPKEVFTLTDFGGGYASPNALEPYRTLVRPVGASSNATLLNDNYSIFVANANSTITSDHLEIGPVSSELSSSPWQVNLGFSHALNLSSFTYLAVRIAGLDQTLVKSLIANQQLWLGVVSSNLVGWYIIDGSSNSYSTILGSDTTTFYLLMGSPDLPSNSVSYNASNVTGVIIQLPSSSTSISMAMPQVYTVSGFSVESAWKQAIASYGIRYLVLDWSMVEGNTSSYSYLRGSLTLAQSAGVLTSEYSGHYLAVFRTNFT